MKHMRHIGTDITALSAAAAWPFSRLGTLTVVRTAIPGCVSQRR